MIAHAISTSTAINKIKEIYTNIIPNPNERKQFVYILSNSKQPGTLKIGYVKRKSATKRAIELGKATGVQGTFKVEYTIFTPDGFKLEKIIHKFLHEYRDDLKKEHFNISKTDVYQKLANELHLNLVPYDPCKDEDTHTHTHSRDLYCESCKIQLSNERRFDIHMKSKKHYDVVNKKFDCSCGNTYPDKKECDDHKKKCDIHKANRKRNTSSENENTIDYLQKYNSIPIISLEQYEVLLKKMELSHATEEEIYEVLKYSYIHEVKINQTELDKAKIFFTCWMNSSMRNNLKNIEFEKVNEKRPSSSDQLNIIYDMNDKIGLNNSYETTIINRDKFEKVVDYVWENKNKILTIFNQKSISEKKTYEAVVRTIKCIYKVWSGINFLPLNSKYGKRQYKTMNYRMEYKNDIIKKIIN
jgi:hypothetical protein